MQRFVIRIRDNDGNMVDQWLSHVSKERRPGRLYATSTIGGVKQPSGHVVGRAMLFHSFEAAEQYILEYKAIKLPKGMHHVRLWIEELKPVTK